EYVEIEKINVKNYIAENCTNSEDWNTTFRNMKSKFNEIEKLPTSLKIACITVNCIPVRSIIEFQLQIFYDRLVSELRSHIFSMERQHVKNLSKITENLSRKPTAISDIAKFNEFYHKQLKVKPSSYVTLNRKGFA
ncbi:hypothetical protein A3Q56_08710, partial [Intoshia linei]